jgi:hypothetical protein
MEQIIIQQEYFDNIQKAVESINEFFSSGFETKNFPTDRSKLEYAISWIIDILNDLDVVYVKDQITLDNVVSDLETKLNEMDPIRRADAVHDRSIANAINSIIAYAALQQISENFDQFQNLINGIYTFEIFMDPAKYQEAIELFTQNLTLPGELEEIDEGVAIFSVQEYVNNLLLGNELIKFPETMNDPDVQIQRMLDFQPVKDAEVVIGKSSQVQEAAIDALSTPKASHIKYNSKENRFELSQQFSSFVSKFMTDLRKCETVDDLKEYFEKAPDADMMLKNVCPFLVVRAYLTTDAKYKKSDMGKFTEVYDKKLSEDGASRFKNYDIFTTFKADKEGTLDFIEDFLTLKLVNDTSVAITNNVVLAIFNIFDSRLYLDTLYNILPPADKKEKDEDTFVKEIRARINKNSRATNTYQPDMKKMVKDNPNTTEMQEYVTMRLDMFGDMTPSEMQICEEYAQVLYDEISMVDDRVYNNRMSPSKLDRIVEAFVPYKKKGVIPDYMKSRMQISDDEPGQKEPTTTQVPDPIIPPPENSIDDLADSVESKMGMDGNLDDVMGSGFEENPDKKKASQIVYNITYTNSFNRDSHNTTTNDLSTGKHVTTINDLSSNKTKSDTNVGGKMDSGSSTVSKSNNNSNSGDSSDSKDIKIETPSDGRKFSNGMSVQEMFAILESEEPLSVEDASNTKGNSQADSLTDSVSESRKAKAAREEKRNQRMKEREERRNQRANDKAQHGGPIKRVKMWLTDMVNSLIQRDEDQVKSEIIESPNYRTALFKAGRLAIKLGLTGIAFTISGWLGAACLGVLALRHADKTRLRREVTDEFYTEIKITDEKIEHLKHNDDPESRKQMYQLMRLRERMLATVSDAQANRWRNPDKFSHRGF